MGVSEASLESAVAAVPPGGWGVAVSGGGDSVALLILLARRADLRLHVIHLDHQTRGAESDADARFVGELALRLGLPATIARRDELERGCRDLPGNPAARYRALRIALFRQVVCTCALDGVILAHHADDQAETVLHRLIRGVSAEALAGMSPQTRIGSLLVLRPLLHVTRAMLRDHLRSIGQPWREDSSNASPKYLRNRLRAILSRNPELRPTLLELGRACGELRDWAQAATPRLAERFATCDLAGLPDILARHAARQWLIDRGAPAQEISRRSIDRLLEMATDAAAPARAQFPGAIRVARRPGNVMTTQPTEDTESKESGTER